MNTRSLVAWTVLIGLLCSLAFQPVTAQQRTNVVAIGGLAPVAAVCDDPSLADSININLSAGTGNTEIRALASGVVIYVCGWKWNAGGAAVIKWIYGTGTACATGETAMATMRAFAAGDGEAISNGGGVQFKTPVSNALCVDRDTSVTLDGHVTIARVTP